MTTVYLTCTQEEVSEEDISVAEVLIGGLLEEIDGAEEILGGALDGEVVTIEVCNVDGNAVVDGVPTEESYDEFVANFSGLYEASE